MVMVSRFPGKCRNCNGRISVGDSIEWEKGLGAVHESCPANVEAVAEPVRISVEEVGVYVMPNGDIVKVQPNKEKTRTYAKRWVVIGGERLVEAGERAHGDYVFEPGLVADVAAHGRRMTLAEARHFLTIYGQCARCSRHLKAAQSVEQGLGPVCVRYFSFAAEPVAVAV